MAALTVATSTDYSSDVLTDIDTILLDPLALSVTATFAASQFDDVQISRNVLIDGSAADDFIEVTGALQFSAASWTFADFAGSDAVIIRGAIGAPSNITGSTKRDYIEGAGFVDTLNGGSGNDTLVGAGGADVLDGGNGNDLFFYRAASHIVAGEIIIGGAGTADKLAFYSSNNSCDFSLATISGVEIFDVQLSSAVPKRVTFAGTQIGGASGIQSLGASIYHGPFTLVYVVNGSAIDLSSVFIPVGGTTCELNGTAGADTIIGSGVPDIVSGGAGNDAMQGGAGDDVIRGGGGNDDIDGGVGTDTLDCSSATSIGVTVDLGNAGPQAISATQGADTLAGIENVIGSVRDDDLTGDAFANVLDGRDGADTLRAGAGNDKLDGGLGADAMSGGTANDTYFVDDAGDTVTELLNQGYDIVNTSLGSYTLSANVERVNYTGLGFFTGIGNALDNYFQGGSNYDSFIDIAGGADTFIGGDGLDTVDYRASATGVNINFTTVAFGGAAAGDTFSSIEFYLGSDSAADVIIGDTSGSRAVTYFFVNGNGGDDRLEGYRDSFQNGLSGGDGNDLIKGGSGSSSDELEGGAGNDTLDGGASGDRMYGGSQNDTYFVDNLLDTVIELVNKGYDSVNTTLTRYTLASNCERLTFLGLGDFVGTGNGLDNRFQGGVGDDIFIDVAGGADTFSGGAGTDTVDFRASATGAVLDFTSQVHGGAAAGDIYASIEKFLGSNTAKDTMTGGGTGRFVFVGGGGNDVLTGGVKNDQLLGQVGQDTLTGGADRDALDGGTGDDVMTGGSGGDVFIYLDAAFGQDTITDYQDGLDKLKVFSAVADDISDFTITGNGTASVVLTLAASPGNFITVNGAAPITISAADFAFY